MARRVLTGLALSVLLAPQLSGCRREQPEPKPSAQVAASSSSYASRALDRHYEEELERTRKRWASKPGIGDCSVLREKADAELCQAATTALAAIVAEPSAPPVRALPLLSEGAIALTRLSKRTRYLALSEVGERRIEGDAGPERKLELSDGPVTRLMSSTVRLERDVVRTIGAYLEYAELPVRRDALATVKGLREQHPQWPLLNQTIREAWLLERDPELKRALGELDHSGLPRGGKPGQSPFSK